LITRPSKIVFVIVLLLSSTAYAEREPWSKETYISFGTMLFFSTIDCLQTCQIAENPEEYQEANALLDDHPSTGEVIAFMVGTKLLMYGVSFLLPDKWRIMLFSVSAGGHAACAWHNNEVGIRF